MRVGDGVDDELAEVEFGGERAELFGDAVGCADEVAWPLVVFGCVERAGGEGQQRVGGGWVLR